MANTSEIDYLLTTRASSLKETTLDNYKNYYRRLRLLVRRPIIDTAEAEIIRDIDNGTYTDADTKNPAKIGLKLPVSIKSSILNVAIVIRQLYNLPVDKLILYRKSLKGDILEANVDRAKELKDTLPTYKTLVDYTDKLFEEGQYVKYVINYLLISLGVRNMDLNLIITRDNSLVNNTDNWLVIRKTSIRYLRYNFKTADAYECRENEIKNDKLRQSLEEILGEDDETYLLQTADGERLKTVNLNKYISRATYKGLGQAKYFKIMLNRNKTDIERLSVNRGTNFKTMIEHYDISFKDLEGKQKALRLADKLKDKSAVCRSKIPEGESGADRLKAKATKKKTELEKSHAELSEIKIKADERLKNAREKRALEPADKSKRRLKVQRKIKLNRTND